MTGVVGLEVRGVERVQANLKRAESDARFGIESTMRSLSIEARKRLVRRLTGVRAPGGFWGPGRVAGAYLGGRSGQTRARISPGGVVLRHGNQVIAPVGSPDKHMLLHEEGGTIPGWSRIPTAAAQTGAGVDINAGRSVRGLPGYHPVRTRAGRLWIVKDEGFARVGQSRGGNTARMTFMYLLKWNAKHRGRGIFKAVRDEMEPEAMKEAGARMAVVTQRANG